jgi:Asp-tRNA(Asn)/Glu-tRNA(Gln) amidotransferase A subunit family amidase
VPVAHAADGMGSIRIPAACCGLVGIKPGSGLVPAQLGTNSWYGMSENGVLGTTVADAALVLSVMADDPALAEVREPERARCASVPRRSLRSTASSPTSSTCEPSSGSSGGSRRQGTRSSGRTRRTR